MTEFQTNWQAIDQDYRAFLLRCWRESDCPDGEEPEGSENWYFALVEISNHSQTECFASLEELIIYLRERLRSTVNDAATLSDVATQKREDPLNNGSDEHRECR
jgi:hypothetical protein